MNRLRPNAFTLAALAALLAAGRGTAAPGTLPAGGGPVPAAAPRGSPAQDPPAQDQEKDQEKDPSLAETLAREDLVLDREAGVLSIPATVLIKNDLLEYLLVASNGAGHESLFLTRVRPSLLNAALLLLGVEPGTNAYVAGGEVDERGHTTRQVYPPQGDGFYLYAAWREGEETYVYRVEDLVRNLESGRALRRHRWVYLGSRFQALKPGGPEAFLADVEGNLINLSFFFQGNTLLTAAVEECREQTIWVANEWLLPESGASVRLYFARAPLEGLAPAWLGTLPDAAAPRTDAEGSGRR